MLAENLKVEPSNILVVEDNPSQRATLCDILEFEGDKAIAHWGLMDTAKMMQQLGVEAATE